MVKDVLMPDYIRCGTWILFIAKIIFITIAITGQGVRDKVMK
jgi:hypothetical protein